MLTPGAVLAWAQWPMVAKWVVRAKCPVSLETCWKHVVNCSEGGIGRFHTVFNHLDGPLSSNESVEIYIPDVKKYRPPDHDPTYRMAGVVRPKCPVSCKTCSELS